MRILNLGCGTKTSASPDVVNVDRSIYLRLKRNPFLRPLVPILVRGQRLQQFRALSGSILMHDLTRGLPFDDGSVDAVYHSHLLEHFDSALAERLLLEVKRVLKPNGVQRIAVPDFEEAARRYLAHVAVCEGNEAEVERHDSYIATLLAQSVRRECWGTSQQPPLRRFVENTLLGDARQRGETHQWMYDRFNLSALLTRLGYRDPRVEQFNTSRIARWNEYGLDQNETGAEYKPESLYLEVVK
jgi:SAM-dependent methyltransferase